jgi:DNA invertase Pin-like site-specific DNA recombinase
MNNIAYYRVSRPQQGKSGLGLAAQKDSVLRFLGNTLPIAEFVEVESGKQHRNRPQLQAALELCKKRKARLVIAKLDRLARNVAFISALMESEVDFVCCDNPHATRLMLHIMAAFAEHERDIISERLKSTMGRIKAELIENGFRISHTGRRYTRLGNPRLEEARLKAAEARRGLTPSIETIDHMGQMRGAGMSLRAIAEQLNRWSLRTGHGNKWHQSTVATALARYHESTKGRKPESVLSLNPDFSQLNDPVTPAIPSFLPCNAGHQAKTEGVFMFDLAEAYQMLDTFVGSGATTFDVTFLDIDGQKRGFRAGQTARQLRTSLPQLVSGLQERQQNIIVRPHSDKVTFIQLDDLSADKTAQLEPVACLTLETSPGNHQAWVAVSDLIPSEEKDFARRLRKGVGADLNASGATRVAGTPNYKVKYRPEFPTVKIAHSAPGRIATREQLEAMGIVAATEPFYEAPASPFRVSSVGRSWPDYDRCVQGAPMKHGENKPDISRADFFFALMAAQRGWDAPDIASRLMDLSSKAKENGQRYADLTAENAVAATERQRRSRA